MDITKRLRKISLSFKLGAVYTHAWGEGCLQVNLSRYNNRSQINFRYISSKIFFFFGGGGRKHFSIRLIAIICLQRYPILRLCGDLM